ncbi:MAG: xylose isomerase [Azospirillum brasilense]|nr:MAG: xylose isomerase [Azospirillum brasilense]
MERVFSLAALTALELAPPAMIDVAAATGCALVGLRLIPVAPGATAYPLMDDKPLMRDTLARIRDTGVKVADLEIVMLRPDTDIAALRPFFEAGAELGAKNVLVAGYDPDEARLIDSFARFCQEAAPFGLTGDLEFMPWTQVPDLPTAIRVVEKAGQPNGGVLVDALHFDRSNSTLEDVAKLPRHRMHYWQMCDAPSGRNWQDWTTEELLHTARADRRFPGDGGIDLVALTRAMPADIPVSLEIPTLELAKTVGAEERVRRAVAAAKRVIAAAEG